MKILLVGPIPPPSGGISVHVMQTHRRLTAAGVTCHVLNPAGAGGKVAFIQRLLHYASQGWAIDLHTNGHNRRSWLLALSGGLIARIFSVPASLTLHSGMVPRYLARGAGHRALAGTACHLYRHITCVSPGIEEALTGLGIERERMEVCPAYTPPGPLAVTLDQPLVAWIEKHRPLLSATLFFRPEYGFPLLVEAVARLRRIYPAIGCIVMGSCEQGEEALNQIRNADVEEQMLLLGDVEHDRCLSVIGRSDLFVRPTLHDGDSISVREALALGVPVVASRTGNRPTGVHLFETGDPGDLVAQALRALPAEMGATNDVRIYA